MLLRPISLTRRKSVGTNSGENETCLVHAEIQCVYHRGLSISSGFFPMCKLLIILNAGNFRRRTIKTPGGRGGVGTDGWMESMHKNTAFHPKNVTFHHPN